MNLKKSKVESQQSAVSSQQSAVSSQQSAITSQQSAEHSKQSPSITPSPNCPLRPPEIVMKLERLGAFFQTRLSFVRVLLRRMAREKWRIERHLFMLDDDGYGTAVYKISATNDEIYSVVLFSQHIHDDERTDRVIAEKWDIAAVLCEGIPNDERLAQLRQHVPKQEAGRNRSDVLVLSRANKSGRLFNSVIEALSQGEQPDIDTLTQVGYLVRTTAVYGNGKFGLADYVKLSDQHTFQHSFSAQLFTVYMIRLFSVELVEHIAMRRAPKTAVTIHPAIKRFVGVGNATGLGMAPFLVKHPKLLNQWILARETAVAHLLYQVKVTPLHLRSFKTLLQKAKTHLAQSSTTDKNQQQRYQTSYTELAHLQTKSTLLNSSLNKGWQPLYHWAASNCSIETQELLLSLLMESHPDAVDAFEAQPLVDETLHLQPEMPIVELVQRIENHYQWAISIDYTQPKAQHLFWYRSAEKEEPRLGERFAEAGAEKEQFLGIGRAVAELYEALTAVSPHQLTLHFLLQQPHFTGIVRRIQTLAEAPYGEIQDNLLDADCLPIHMLRCKLSFFGASKFDPKSRLWTRITLFQGAPYPDELTPSTADDWAFPIAPA